MGPPCIAGRDCPLAPRRQRRRMPRLAGRRGGVGENDAWRMAPPGAYAADAGAHVETITAPDALHGPVVNTSGRRIRRLRCHDAPAALARRTSVAGGPRPAPRPTRAVHGLKTRPHAVAAMDGPPIGKPGGGPDRIKGWGRFERLLVAIADLGIRTLDMITGPGAAANKVTAVDLTQEGRCRWLSPRPAPRSPQAGLSGAATLLRRSQPTWDGPPFGIRGEIVAETIPERQGCCNQTTQCQQAGRLRAR